MRISDQIDSGNDLSSYCSLVPLRAILGRARRSKSMCEAHAVANVPDGDGSGGVDGVYEGARGRARP